MLRNFDAPFPATMPRWSRSMTRKSIFRGIAIGRMTIVFGILSAIAVSATADPPKAESLSTTAPPEPADMQVLFNGDDLTGWDGDPEMWSVRDGVIHGETTPEIKAKGNTFLIWQGGEPADFELRLSFRCNAVNNSGIQYRSKPREKGRNKWTLMGYQHEVRNEVGFPNVPGFIYDEGGSRRRLILVGEQAVQTEDGKQILRDDLIGQEEFKKLMKLDEFNDVIIIAKGNHIQHFLNGKLLIDFRDEHPTKALSKGKIGLQLHAGKPMFAEFKDIRIKVYK